MINLPSKRLIFLDLDGTINRHVSHPILKYHTIDKDLAQLFNELLWKTKSEFVLTSSWRYMALCGSMTLQGLQNLLLSHWVDGNKLIGVTRADINKERIDRGPQITEWIQNNVRRPAALKYVVLDDMDLEISPHPLVLVNAQTGLTQENVSQAAKFLR